MPHFTTERRRLCVESTAGTRAAEGRAGGQDGGWPPGSVHQPAGGPRRRGPGRPSAPRLPRSSCADPAKKTPGEAPATIPRAGAISRRQPDPRSTSPLPAALGEQNGGAGRGEGRGGGKGREGKSGRGGEGRGPPWRGRASPPPLATASTVPLPAALSSSRPGRRGTAAEEERSAAARAVRTPSGQAWGGGGSAPPPSLLLPPQAQPRSPSPPARKAPDLLRVRARAFSIDIQKNICQFCHKSQEK